MVPVAPEGETDLLLGSWPTTLTGLCKAPASLYCPCLIPDPPLPCAHRHPGSRAGWRCTPVTAPGQVGTLEDYRFTCVSVCEFAVIQVG